MRPLAPLAALVLCGFASSGALAEHGPGHRSAPRVTAVVAVATPEPRVEATKAEAPKLAAEPTAATQPQADKPRTIRVILPSPYAQR